MGQRRYIVKEADKVNPLTSTKSQNETLVIFIFVTIVYKVLR